ncbi:MFS transporter [Buchnera aphidicola (Pemphigus obesinymphae)]|uniref:MFS transporter n=1 Tax=Buchnera aphidicola TaxID=9 RepID=UPI002238B823|nr:MFS transporter [Buchnera aphidicola]MCW5196728.1 MFS transporter [Buchnera aphidicola (Pemphigus obesinymphae)]
MFCFLPMRILKKKILSYVKKKYLNLKSGTYIQRNKIPFKLNRSIVKQEKVYIKKGTKKFKEVILAFFSAGLSTFAILYCVQPILPLFSEKFHLSPAQSSLSLSSATSMMAIGMLFTGPLSDFLGRKKIMSISLFLAAFCTIFCSTMHSWEAIIIMRALTGLALSGVVAVAMTYLSEEIDPIFLAFSMGLYISGNTIGGCLGRFLTSILATYFSWEIALRVIGISALITAGLFLYLLPNSKNFNSAPLNTRKLFFDFLLQCKDPALSKLFFIGFIIMGSFVTLFNYVGYRLMLSPFYINQTIIGFLSLFYLIGVYSSPQAGILTEKYNKGVVLISALLLMISGLFITQSNHLCFIFMGLILFAAGFFAAHSVASSWIGHHTTVSKAQTSSLYLFFYYLGSSIVGTCGGFFWFSGGWTSISLFIFSILILGIFLAIRLERIEKNNH